MGPIFRLGWWLVDSHTLYVYPFPIVPVCFRRRSATSCPQRVLIPVTPVLHHFLAIRTLAGECLGILAEPSQLSICPATWFYS